MDARKWSKAVRDEIFRGIRARQAFRELNAGHLQRAFDKFILAMDLEKKVSKIFQELTSNIKGQYVEGAVTSSDAISVAILSKAYGKFNMFQPEEIVEEKILAESTTKPKSKLPILPDIETDPDRLIPNPLPDMLQDFLRQCYLFCTYEKPIVNENYKNLLDRFNVVVYYIFLPLFEQIWANIGLVEQGELSLSHDTLTLSVAELENRHYSLLQKQVINETSQLYQLLMEKTGIEAILSQQQLYSKMSRDHPDFLLMPPYAQYLLRPPHQKTCLPIQRMLALVLLEASYQGYNECLVFEAVVKANTNLTQQTIATAMFNDDDEDDDEDYEDYDEDDDDENDFFAYKKEGGEGGGDGDDEDEDDDEDDFDEGQEEVGEESSQKLREAKAQANFQRLLDMGPSALIYYIIGYVIRRVLGLRSIIKASDKDRDIVLSAILQRFACHSDVARNENLPTSVVFARSHHANKSVDGKLILAAKDLFEATMALEEDVISPMLDNTRLLVLLNSQFPNLIAKKARAHPFATEVLPSMIGEALRANNIVKSIVPEESEEFELLVKGFSDKFLDVYLNVAFNDLVLSAIPKKWKAENKSFQNISFRMLQQFKNEKKEESAAKKKKKKELKSSSAEKDSSEMRVEKEQKENK